MNVERSLGSPPTSYSLEFAPSFVVAVFSLIMGTCVSLLSSWAYNGSQTRRENSSMKSIWNLIEGIDSFPYYAHDPVRFKEFMQDYYYFTIEGYPRPLGLVYFPAVQNVPWPSYWSIDHKTRRLHLMAPEAFDKRTELLNETVRLAKKHSSMEELRLQGHPQAVLTARREHLCNMDPAGWQILGIPAFGVHLIAWRNCPFFGRHYWLQRRSRTKTIFPGRLDMVAGGGIHIGETARDAMAREAFEEAKIPEKYSQKHLRACGPVSYHLSWSFCNNPGSFPHVLYMFELELPWHMTPKKNDDEVDEFVSMSESQVMDSLFYDDFKPILGIQWVDHFCRHGRLTVDNEPRLVEISSRMHRNLELAPLEEEWFKAPLGSSLMGSLY